MLRYRELTATLKGVIKLQGIIMMFLVIAVLGAGIGWQHALDQQSFHVPPDLRTGAVVKKGDVPPANVYAFAHYIFQQLNRWPNEGVKDYGRNIFRLSAYLTPKFRAELEADLKMRGKRGELTVRTRGVSEIPGASYEERRVQRLGNGTWVVWLDLSVNEWVRGMQVKNAHIRYPLQIVRYDIDREANPWGLALNGYAENPRRLTKDEYAQVTGKSPGKS